MLKLAYLAVLLSKKQLAFSALAVKRKPQTDLGGWAAPVWGGCEGLELIVITEDKCLGDHLHLRFNDACWNLMTVG